MLDIAFCLAICTPSPNRKEDQMV